MAEVKRRASHAGSWYTKNSKELQEQLQALLDGAKVNSAPLQGVVRGIIGPHAGYSYCGPTAAHGYKLLTPSSVSAITRIFVIGPSHHVHLDNTCALSTATLLQTPLGALSVCRNTISQLKQANPMLFTTLSMEEEEDEHSLEMHFPWIAKCFDAAKVKIVPIIVGQLSVETANALGKILCSFLQDTGSFFVISSDFCHWGKRFGYTFYDKQYGAIYESIEKLDRMGMEAIESLDPQEFHRYMKQYKNTICGRNPISVFMHTIDHTKDKKYSMHFVHYSQSSKVTMQNDSSVSYAAGILLQSPNV